MSEAKAEREPAAEILSEVEDLCKAILAIRVYSPITATTTRFERCPSNSA